MSWPSRCAWQWTIALLPDLGAHPARGQPTALSDLVLRASQSFALGGTPVSARVCNTLREAAESPDAPYFYECYFDFCHKPIPFGHAYIAWRAATDKAMQTGHEIAYCGRPSRPVDESTAHASRNEGRPEAI